VSLISSSKLLASLSVECFLFLFQVLVGLFGLSITGISSLCEFEFSELEPSAEPSSHVTDEGGSSPEKSAHLAAQNIGSEASRNAEMGDSQ
jgi:hypothetical protein